MQTLDQFDRALLSLLQRDAEVTTSDLGEQVGLSPSAVQRRLKKLRADGVITSYVAVIDPAKVGQPSFFVVGLEVDRERAELLSRLRAWLTAEDAVQQVYYVTGGWDFVLIVTADDLQAYDAFVSRLMAENPNVRRFTTNVALAAHKRTSFVPIPALAD